MDIALNLALLDFEEVALLLLATSWLLGTRALGPLKPLARGEEFRTVSGIEVASFRSDGNDSLFNGRAWSAAAAGAAMAKGCELQACGLWQEGELRLSLALRLERWSGVTLAFPLTDPLAQYSDLQGEGDALGLLERTVRYLARSTDARALVFFRVRSGTALAEALDRMGAARLRSGQAPYIDLARHASHEAWLASFGATTRKSRRQRRRRLETRGTVAFQAITAGAEAGRAAQAILVLKRNWMRANGLKSRVLDDPHWSSALAEIISSADSNAVVSCLTLDGKLIAGEIGFVAEGVYCSYLGAYDRDFATFGAGTLQMIETVRWCFEAGIGTLDLLPPEDAYKTAWTCPENRREVSDYALSVDGVGLLGAAVVARLMAHGLIPTTGMLRNMGLRRGPRVRVTPESGFRSRSIRVESIRMDERDPFQVS